MEGIDAGLARCEELGIRYATEVSFLQLDMTTMRIVCSKPQVLLFRSLHVKVRCAHCSCM
jgi:hypothetical protein